MTLKVKPEVLKTKAEEVENDIRALEIHFNSIQEIVARSSGYWVGTAGDKARKEFDSQKEDTTTVIKRFRDHPKNLLVMAGVYEQSEQSLTLQNQRLSTDVIV